MLDHGILHKELTKCCRHIHLKSIPSLSIIKILNSVLHELQPNPYQHLSHTAILLVLLRNKLFKSMFVIFVKIIRTLVPLANDEITEMIRDYDKINVSLTITVTLHFLTSS